MSTFITLNELSRAAGVPVSRINAAITAGVITPAGRAGGGQNAAIIFSAEEVQRLVAALKTGIYARAGTSPKHRCKTPAEILSKADALSRASQEVSR